MNYLPSLRLSFPDGTSNEYRLHQNRLEFRTSTGKWRVLDDDELKLHFILRTDVAKWVMRESSNANRTGNR